MTDVDCVDYGLPINAPMQLTTPSAVSTRVGRILVVGLFRAGAFYATGASVSPPQQELHKICSQCLHFNHPGEAPSVGIRRLSPARPYIDRQQ
jgi:hypothetical protein